MEIAAAKTFGQGSNDAARWLAGFCTRPLFLMFLASRVAIVVAFKSVASDVPWAYFPVARTAVTGTGMPYVDVPFPYPPGALLAVVAPALIRSDYWGYHLAFQAEMVLADVLTFVLMTRFLETTMRARASAVRAAMLTYGLLTAALGTFIYDRLDMLIALTFMAAVVTFRPAAVQGTRYLAVVVAGILVKIVPVFWVPIAGVSRSAVRRALFAVVVPVGLVMLTANVLTSGGLLRSLQEHGQRAIEIESVWATPLVLAKSLHLVSGVLTETSFGSVNLSGPAVSPALVTASKWAGFAALAGFYVWWLRRRGTVTGLPSPLQHALALLFVLILLISTQRVLSPQYFLWLIPGFAVAIAATPRRAVTVTAVIAMYGLTSYLFPTGFPDVIAFRPVASAMLAARNVLLIGLGFWVLATLNRTFGSDVQ